MSTLGNSNATFTGTIDYNGVDKFNLDYKLIPAREDSIMLVYRPDSKSPWIQHPSYSKLGTSATDKKDLCEFRISFLVSMLLHLGW